MEVDVLGSPSLILRTVSVDVKRIEEEEECYNFRAQKLCEPVWPSGKAVPIRFGSPFSSKVVVCGHCLVTLSLTVNETFKVKVQGF